MSTRNWRQRNTHTPRHEKKQAQPATREISECYRNALLLKPIAKSVQADEDLSSFHSLERLDPVSWEHGLRCVLPLSRETGQVALRAGPALHLSFTPPLPASFQAVARTPCPLQGLPLTSITACWQVFKKIATRLSKSLFKIRTTSSVPIAFLILVHFLLGRLCEILISACHTGWISVISYCQPVVQTIHSVYFALIIVFVFCCCFSSNREQ